MIELRPHQQEAFRRILPHDGFLLFMEQRTGKTYVALRVAAERKPARLLITCPEIAIEVWRKALAAHGPIPGCVVRIVTHSMLSRERARLRRWAPDGVIADELHRFKSVTSKQSRALRSIAKTSDWRLGLTGTPTDGRAEHIWAQMYFANPSVFGKWTEFKAKHLVYGGFRKKKIVEYINMETYKRKLDRYSYRVELAEVQAVKTRFKPPTFHRFDLTGSAQAYADMEASFMVGLHSGARVVAPRVITQIMKLHQLSGGFVIDAEGEAHWFGHEKIEITMALILKIARTRPMVVVVRFLPELYRLAQLCRHFGISVDLISGGSQFTSFTADVAIVQARSGLAIDLSRASIVVFHSFGYSYLDYEQSKFRILTYDKTPEAEYHYVLANNSIDNDIYQCLISKQSVASFIINKYRR